MVSLAVVILAHADPTHLHRFVAALTDIPVFLHIDAKTSPQIASEMLTGLPSRVSLVNPIPANLGSWSLVQAELNALRMALGTAADHVLVASGADYPLIGMEALEDALRPWKDLSHFWNTPIPYPGWDTPHTRDGGLWRFNRRFVSRHAEVVSVREVPARIPLRRPIPKDLQLRAASQWKIYSRYHVHALLRVVDTRPDLVRFARTTFIPDESFTASVLSSPSLVTENHLVPCRASAWFVKWGQNGGSNYHPNVLGTEDAEDLLRAVRAEPMTPEDARLPYTVKTPHQKWFARKFTSAQPAILELIDQTRI